MVVIFRTLRKYVSRRTLIGICIFAVVALALFVATLVHSYSDLNRAIAETDRLDPGWRRDDLIAALPTIPDEENGALVILKAHAIAEKNTKVPSPVWPDDEMIELEKHPEIQAGDAYRDKCAKAASDGADILPLLLSLRRFQTGRFPPLPGRDATNSLAVSRQKEMNTVRKTLAAHMRNGIESGDPATVVEGFCAAGGFGRSIGDDPCTVAQLLRASAVWEHLPLMERALAQVTFSERQLADLARELEELNSPPWLTDMARGKRAMLNVDLENVRNSTSPQVVASYSGATSISWFTPYLTWSPGYMRTQQAQMLRLMNRYVDDISQPEPERTARLAAWRGEVSKTTGLVRDFLYHAETQNDYLLWHLATVRTTLVGIAAERFRLRHDRWPESIGELVDTKLIGMPFDPFDAQPIRWKVVPQGRVIYSLGTNRIDDGGQRFDPHGQRLDVVFRLFDPDKRRQPPRPLKATGPGDPAILDESQKPGKE